MRSFFKLHGTALLAVAALFAVVASPSTANAFTFRPDAVRPTVQSGPETVQSVAFNWWNARQARRDVAQALRADCRDASTREERRECFRETRSALREMQDGAREAYRDCRTNRGSRRECREAVWQYWVDQANNTSDTTDDGTDTGGVTNDLPL